MITRSHTVSVGATAIHHRLTVGLNQYPRPGPRADQARPRGWLDTSHRQLGKHWRTRRDSNRQPSDPQARAGPVRKSMIVCLRRALTQCMCHRPAASKVSCCQGCCRRQRLSDRWSDSDQSLAVVGATWMAGGTQRPSSAVGSGPYSRMITRKGPDAEGSQFATLSGPGFAFCRYRSSEPSGL